MLVCDDCPEAIFKLVFELNITFYPISNSQCNGQQLMIAFIFSSPLYFFFYIKDSLVKCLYFFLADIRKRQTVSQLNSFISTFKKYMRHFSVDRREMEKEKKRERRNQNVCNIEV